MPNVTADEPRLRSSLSKGRTRRIANGAGNGHVTNGAAKQAVKGGNGSGRASAESLATAEG